MDVEAWPSGHGHTYCITGRSVSPPRGRRAAAERSRSDSGWRLARCTDSIDRSSSDWRLQRCSSSLLLRLRLWCVGPRLSPCAAEPKRHGGYPADQQRHELGERTGAAAGAGRTQPGTRSKPRSRHRLRVGERRAVLATRQHISNTDIPLTMLPLTTLAAAWIVPAPRTTTTPARARVSGSTSARSALRSPAMLIWGLSGHQSA